MTVPRLSVRPTLPPGVYLRRPREQLPYPLGDANCRIFARAGQALFFGVRALGLGPGDEALVSAHHHGSEVEGLGRAGVRPRFYDEDERLEPDQDHLSALLTKSVRVLYLTHYLGFPQDALRWRRWCDQHGLLLIEDAARSWLGSRDGLQIGSLADLAVFCLHETLGLPEAAALVSRAPPGAPLTDPRWGVVDVMRDHGAWLAQRSPSLSALTGPLQRAAPVTPGGGPGIADAEGGVRRAVPWLLPRLCDPGIAARRRANFQFLLDAIGDCAPTPFDDLPAGASPFAFPICADDRARLLERLEAHGVLGLDLWPVPDSSLRGDGLPGPRHERWRAVGLPVHQELRPGDLERIVAASRPGNRSTRELRVERLPGVEAAGDEWRALAESSDNIFATPEWLSTWWRHFGRDEQRILGCRRRDASLAAILPLYRSRLGPARALRFLGHGPSDQLGPVCNPGERAAVARALRRGLRDGMLGDWDVLLGEQLPGQLGWSALLGGTVVRHESCPVVRARGRSFEELLASRSANFRQQVRRREGKLRREHGLRYRLADDPARLQDDLTLLFDLHAARWSGGASAAFSPRRQAFHREFAAMALERGWLRLWLAEADGGAVAALHGFRFARSELYYQSGRDPGWDRHAVGFVLLAHAVRTALDDGVAEYRLLRGDEPYKRRFADDDPGLETMVTARGALGRAAVAIASPLAERDRPRRWLSRAARYSSA